MTKRMLMLAASFVMALALNAGVVGKGGAAEESLSKQYRITRAKDVEFQKCESAKVFDNLYYVGPGYVSVWLLTTPQGDILFDSAQEPYVDWVLDTMAISTTSGAPRRSRPPPGRASSPSIRTGR